jgi:hypothetical protein
VADRARVDGTKAPGGVTHKVGVQVPDLGAVEWWAKGKAANQGIIITIRGRRD